MSIWTSLGFGGNQNNTPTGELINIFPLALDKDDFIKQDILTIYRAILTDTLERTYGIKQAQESLLWDNCVLDGSSKGLVSLISNAMYNMDRVYIVWDPSTNILREADPKERAEMDKIYTSGAKPKNKVALNFSNLNVTKMLKIYSELDYRTNCSINKSLGIASTIQLKLHELRSSVGYNDAEITIEQAKAIAKAMSEGRDIVLDAQDIIELANPDMAPAQKALDMNAQKKSFYLKLPASWITGLNHGSISDTGEREAKAVERGLKRWFYSIVKPTVEALFGITATYKSEDFYGLQTAISTLQTFELTSNEYISAENKLRILNSLFGLPANSKGDELEEKPDPNDEDPTDETQDEPLPQDQ